MELNTSLTLVRRRYIAPTIVVIMCLAGAGWQLWKEHKALTAQAIMLKNEQMAFYKERMEAKEKLLQWEKMLEQREQALIAQGQAQEKEQEARELAAEQRREQLSLNSASEQKRSAREQLHALMSEFAATGASLQRLPDCADKEGWRNYNRADALYASAKAIADANQLTREYAEFFSRNGHGMMVPVCNSY